MEMGIGCIGHSCLGASTAAACSPSALLLRALSLSIVPLPVAATAGYAVSLFAIVLAVTWPAWDANVGGAYLRRVAQVAVTPPVAGGQQMP